MTSKIKWISIIVCIFILIAILDRQAPKPIDWSKSFSTNDKIPFGLFVFDNEILSKNQSITKITAKTPFEYFKEKEDSLNNETPSKHTFIYINESFILDHSSINAILEKVKIGDTFFISCTNFDKSFLKKWNLNIDFYLESNLKKIVLFQQKPYVFDIKEGDFGTYFNETKNSNATVLGYLDTDLNKPNYVRIPFEKGYIYIHLVPIAFTNFHLLKKNHYKYAEMVLQQLPKQHIYWIGNAYSNDGKSQSILRFILKTPALKMTWYLFLIALTTFVFIKIKRKQRVMPILFPPKNTTEDFAKTISNLYKMEQDYPDVIEKKIVFFLEKIRSTYYVDTHLLNDDFKQKLMEKSGQNPEIISEITDKIKHFRQPNAIATKNDLIEIDKLFHSFFENKK